MFCLCFYSIFWLTIHYRLYVKINHFRWCYRNHFIIVIVVVFSFILVYDGYNSSRWHFRLEWEMEATQTWWIFTITALHLLCYVTNYKSIHMQTNRWHNWWSQKNIAASNKSTPPLVFPVLLSIRGKWISLWLYRSHPKLQ